MIRHRTPFLVHTIKETAGLPVGSGVWVDTTLKTHYRGVWASSYGSYTVKVPKKDCRRARREPV